MKKHKRERMKKGKGILSFIGFWEQSCLLTWTKAHALISYDQPYKKWTKAGIG
jgi:hypothetical protein